MSLKITKQDAYRFFLEKNVNVYSCKICNDKNMNTFANPFDDRDDAELFVFQTKSLEDRDGMIAISYFIKFFCNNCNHEITFNAEAIRNWIDKENAKNV